MEETILQNGQPACSLYGDRTHTYIAPSGRCWLDGMEDVVDTYDGWGAHGDGQVYNLHLHTAKSDMKSELRKRCLVHCLQDGEGFDLGSFCTSLLTSSFNLDEPTQFLGAFTECSNSGTGASMMTMKELGDDDAQGNSGGGVQDGGRSNSLHAPNHLHLAHF